MQWYIFLTFDLYSLSEKYIIYSPVNILFYLKLIEKEFISTVISSWHKYILDIIGVEKSKKGKSKNLTKQNIHKTTLFVVPHVVPRMCKTSGHCAMVFTSLNSFAILELVVDTTTSLREPSCWHISYSSKGLLPKAWCHHYRSSMVDIMSWLIVMEHLSPRWKHIFPSGNLVLSSFTGFYMINTAGVL